MSCQLCPLAFILLLICFESSSQQSTAACTLGRFGPDCQYACHCQGTISCHPVTGSCASRECAKGYVGDGCQYVNLAYNTNTSSKQLVDSDVTTCQAQHVFNTHWIDLKAKFWLRRFQVVVNGVVNGDFVNDNDNDDDDGGGSGGIGIRSKSYRPEDAQLFLQVTNSSSAAPEMMSSSNIHVTWSKDGTAYISLKQTVKGRYVWLRGHNLLFCEVYVFGGRNVALFRPTSQSSTLSQLTSSFAVDGITLTNLEEHPCSHTEPQSDKQKLKELFKEKVTWWRVNLTATHVITRVVIYNRDGHLKRLRYFHLWMGSANARHLQLVYRSSQANPAAVIQIIPSRPLSLGLLQVRLHGKKKILTLCEVQIYGNCPDMTFGPSCENKCDCADPKEVCDSFSGSCMSGKRGGVQTPSPIEDNEDDDNENNTDDNTNTNNTVPAIVTVVVVVSAVLIAVVIVVVWRKWKMGRSEKNQETVSPVEAPSQDEGAYEEVGSIILTENAANNRTSNKSLTNFRRRISQLATSVQEKMGKKTTGNHKRGNASADLNDVASEEYQDAGSSGVACAQGEGSGSGSSELYEALGERDYEAPYTTLSPAPASGDK